MNNETTQEKEKEPVSQATPQTELRHIFIFLKRRDLSVNVPAIKREEAHQLRRRNGR